jgi:mono/diheme cytochrome c family protein
MKRLFMVTLLVATSVGLAGAAFASDGAAVYNSKCAMCHGPGGAGTPMAPGLKGSEFVKDNSDKDVGAMILKGRSGAEKKHKNFAMGMPPVPLSDGDLSAVVKYLKSLK